MSGCGGVEGAEGVKGVKDGTWKAHATAGGLRQLPDRIVVFDAPPPYGGVRGIEAYRQTWPPSFARLAQGAVFEMESLDVTAGAEVAFARALLRWGTSQEPAGRPDSGVCGCRSGCARRGR
ncbi:hypothetical protein GCM10010388_24340 [Streptomyces mauvecolor]|uniref:nuclear transport factor 2 family protein n=1 Tax=Streptomyces mauvecolor TaxID=58345 RepID=UPI0031D58763